MNVGKYYIYNEQNAIKKYIHSLQGLFTLTAHGLHFIHVHNYERLKTFLEPLWSIDLINE